MSGRESENSQGNRQVLLDAPIQLSKITDNYGKQCQQGGAVNLLPGFFRQLTLKDITITAQVLLAVTGMGCLSGLECTEF